MFDKRPIPLLSRLSSKKILVLFVLTLYFLLLGYKLMRLGMHADGVEYGSIARNMADGLGSFWKPYHDDFKHPVFHEHPPLVYWIQSFFFKLFGDGPYLEAFYGLFAGLVILGCTAWFWRRVHRDFQLSSTGNWWPMLLLVSLPLFTYTLQVNRLINTYVILAILAAYAAYLSAMRDRHWVFFSLLSGVLIYLGFIAKGPVAFFALAVPVIGWLALKAKLSQAISSTLLAAVTFTVILFATFYFFPDSVDFWKGFWKAQVVVSLKSARSPGDSHWYLVERWAAEMAAPLAIALVFMALARVPLRQIRFNRQALFFLLTALAASLPFLVSTRQHNRYIFQSYPFYVLSLAFVTENIAGKIESLLKDRPKIRLGVGAVAVLFFVAAVSSMLYFKDHDAKRRAFYQDFYLQGIQLPPRITVSACPEDMISRSWLFADMQRYYRISVTAKMGNEYLIIDKKSNCIVPQDYQKVHRQPTRKYILYQKTPLETKKNE
jgi:4-amino-4-deoxy-L-arabinose transferase-like glycosyltransferase